MALRYARFGKDGLSLPVQQRDLNSAYCECHGEDDIRFPTLRRVASEGHRNSQHRAYKISRHPYRPRYRHFASQVGTRSRTRSTTTPSRPARDEASRWPAHAPRPEFSEARVTQALAAALRPQRRKRLGLPPGPEVNVCLTVVLPRTRDGAPVQYAIVLLKEIVGQCSASADAQPYGRSFASVVVPPHEAGKMFHRLFRRKMIRTTAIFCSLSGISSYSVATHEYPRDSGPPNNTRFGRRTETSQRYFKCEDV